jgi:hypothetical protein
MAVDDLDEAVETYERLFGARVTPGRSRTGVKAASPSARGGSS